jgi:hypothetical protein
MHTFTKKTPKKTQKECKSINTYNRIKYTVCGIASRRSGTNEFRIEENLGGSHFMGLRKKSF